MTVQTPDSVEQQLVLGVFATRWEANVSEWTF